MKIGKFLSVAIVVLAVAFTLAVIVLDIVGCCGSESPVGPILHTNGDPRADAGDAGRTPDVDASPRSDSETAGDTDDEGDGQTDEDGETEDVEVTPTGCTNDEACDDGSLCTTDTCEGGECSYAPSMAGCLVGVNCYQAGDFNQSGCRICDPKAAMNSWTAREDGFGCDDGNVCTTSDVCSLGECTGTMPQDCDDGSVCTADNCDPKKGCTNQPIANGTACADNNMCNGEEVCMAGDCTQADPLVCDDGDLCNGVEGCQTNSGCTTGIMLVCDDGLPCNGAEFCDAESGCVVGNPPAGCCSHNADCDDGNVCNGVAACVTGTCEALAPPLLCSDGNVCNGVETCGASEGCVLMDGTEPDCDDENQCTTDSCDPKSGCAHEAQVGDGCSDGTVCTIGDACSSAGFCKSSNMLDCDDENQCTADSCDSIEGCTHSKKSAACNDGDACTIGDVCVEGNCSSGDPLYCNDGNLCTTDSCETETGCVHKGNANPCADGDACTLDDTCVAGSCTGKKQVCDDGVACTLDSCDTTTGCTYTPDNALCDDGNACMTIACDPKKGCSTTATFSCDDGDVCTIDSCDTITGACTHFNPCDDGDACTEDVCELDEQILICSSKQKSCLDGNPCTLDSCDSTNGGCIHSPASGAICDDGDACTTTDACQNGVCKGSGPDEDQDGKSDGVACDDVFDVYCGANLLPEGHANTNQCVTGCRDASGALRYFGGPIHPEKSAAWWHCFTDHDGDGVTPNAGKGPEEQDYPGGDCDNQSTGVVFQCHPDPTNPLKGSQSAFKSTLPEWWTAVEEHASSELPFP